MMPKGPDPVPPLGVVSINKASLSFMKQDNNTESAGVLWGFKELGAHTCSTPVSLPCIPVSHNKDRILVLKIIIKAMTVNAYQMEGGKR